MNPTPEQFVAAARAYLGAPFQHQGWSREGMDCRGLLLRAACDAGIVEEREVSGPDLQTYGREPDGRMAPLLHKFCIKLRVGAELQAGDILAIKYVEEPQHLVIVTRRTKWGPFIIHADNPYGVIEHRLDEVWLRSHRARMHGAFRVKAWADEPEKDCGCGSGK